VPRTDVLQYCSPDLSATDDEVLGGDAVEQQEYSRPRAFRVGPATRLVRGGFIGKAHDAYSGYYMEP
jgi:hypothetical protein